MMCTKNGLLTVEALARLSGIPAHTIRYYARRGLLDPKRNPENAYRLFSESDLARLRFIRQAKSLGFSLGDIHKVFATADLGTPSRAIVQSIIARRVVENRSRLRELTALQVRMEHAIELLSALPDEEHECQSLRDVIEAVSA